MDVTAVVILKQFLLRHFFQTFLFGTPVYIYPIFDDFWDRPIDLFKIAARSFQSLSEEQCGELMNVSSKTAWWMYVEDTKSHFPFQVVY